MSSYKVMKTPGDTEWFMHDRFGMFIHFGTYSLTGRHEWTKKIELTSEEKYQKYFKYFNPDLFDAKEWARKAKEAGMKYAVLTTKHHEGFCLFETKYTDYKITNTPFGRDLVKEYVEAFRAEGLKVGFYYSLIDWHHPDFPIDVNHPRRFDDNVIELDKNRDMTKYAEYMRNQITELLTNYGKIDILWFDFTYNPPFNAFPDVLPNVKPWMRFGGGKGPSEWEAHKMIALVRKLQPHIIINDRIGIKQDIITPEQVVRNTWPTDPETGECIVWEACHTFSGAWGYSRDEMTWKTPKMLISILEKTVALGGNVIMNVGPTGRGCFDERACHALDEFSKWMKYNSRSIYGCTMAEPEFKAPAGTVLTQSEDGKRLYIHIIDYPSQNIEMENLAGKVDYAQFLHDGSEVFAYEGNTVIAGIPRTVEKGYVSFGIPLVAPNMINPVIEVFLK